MKRCPVCNRECEDAAAFCNYDGHAFGGAVPEPDAASLSDLISTQAPFEITRAARLAILICDSTEEMHREGRVIGYLRPQDILVYDEQQSGKSRARVIIKERGSDSIPKGEMPPGEAVYVCPELAQQRMAGAGLAPAQAAAAHDVRSDVFSIGAIFYEMLTGRPPFKASSPAAIVVKQMLERPRPIRDFRSDVPEQLQQAVLRALEGEKTARQQSCAVFRDEIEAAVKRLGGRGGDFASPPAPASPRALDTETGSFPQDRYPTLGAMPVQSAPPPSMPKSAPQSPPPEAVSAPPPTRAAQEDAAETIKTEQARDYAARDESKRCPSCATEFPVSARFCVHDGTALKEESKLAEEKKAPSFYDLQSVEIRKRCPRCGEDYPPNKKFCRYDGQQLIEVSEPRPDEQTEEEMEPVLIGQYNCFARLGEGGMGVVYKARHIHLARLSAVKVLLPQTAALVPNAVKMFQREARLASSINHPNSVIIYDYGEFGQALFYLAMEFIPGRSLAEIIQPKGQPPRPLPFRRVLNITRQICDALEAAHLEGIVHRDLKPQNVMISKRPNGTDLVKVVDFGIARPFKGQSDYQTTAGALVGTPAYMSPEQANAIPDLDARSDIFSLGLMVYEMLGGELPFPLKGLTPMQQAVQRAGLRTPPPPLSAWRSDLNLPPGLDQVLTQALEPDRDRRTQSISLFIQELESISYS
ncbi:MAG TPA: protein kinase [Blastocatellia bacterium]|nr:protein kinase [Blastocatellia bacterium]